MPCEALCTDRAMRIYKTRSTGRKRLTVLRFFEICRGCSAVKDENVIKQGNKCRCTAIFAFFLGREIV